MTIFLFGRGAGAGAALAAREVGWSEDVAPCKPPEPDPLASL